jgi:hypothetical protein
MGDKGEPFGWNVCDLYLKIVLLLTRLRSGRRWRRSRRRGMSESAILLGEFPRLTKSCHSFLFVSSRVDSNGYDFVETVSTQICDIPYGDDAPKLMDHCDAKMFGQWLAYGQKETGQAREDARPTPWLWQRPRRHVSVRSGLTSAFWRGDGPYAAIGME